MTESTQTIEKTTNQTKAGRYVFSFEDGDGKNKKLLGGKGANLCEMTQIGINVPPGFVISTEACLDYLATGPVKHLDDVAVETSAASSPEVLAGKKGHVRHSVR